MRAQLEDIPGGLRIVIPARRGWGPLWATLWFAFLFSGQQRDFFEWRQWRPGAEGFGFYWVLAISLFIVFAHLRDWAWMLGGAEVVEITADALAVRREYFGMGVSQKYSLREVHDLHYVSSEKHGKRQIPEGIGFNYRGKLRRFAAGLQEAEVNHLLGQIKLRAQALGLAAQATTR